MQINPTDWVSDNRDINESDTFLDIVSQKFNRARGLASIAEEMRMDDQEHDLNSRLLKITPIWYICIIRDVIWSIYGLDTGQWVLEGHNGIFAQVSITKDKKILFDALGLDNDTDKDLAKE